MIPVFLPECCRIGWVTTNNGLFSFQFNFLWKIHFLVGDKNEEHSHALENELKCVKCSKN